MGGRARGAQSGSCAPHLGLDLGNPALHIHPVCLTGLQQRTASPLHSRHASVSHSASQQSPVLLLGPAEEGPVFCCSHFMWQPFDRQDPSSSASLEPARPTPSPWRGKCPKAAQKAQITQHKGGQGWDWLSRPLCTQKFRTPSHSSPFQRLHDPKALAKSNYFPVFQSRAQQGYGKQLCQTNLTSSVEEI